MPPPPVAADTPTGLPYGAPRAAGRRPPAPAAVARPVTIGAPGWSIALHCGAAPPLDTPRVFDVVVVDPDHVADPTIHLKRSAGRSAPFAYASVDVQTVQTIAASLEVRFLSVPTVFFHLDERRGVLGPCVPFVVANGGLTLLSLQRGPQADGYGFALSLLRVVTVGFVAPSRSFSRLEDTTFMLL